MFFQEAKPVWVKEADGQRNILLHLRAKWLSPQPAKLAIACEDLYRVYVNGELVGHGPQRSARDTWRVDDVHLSNLKEENEIDVLVQAHFVKAFEYMRQEPFVQAELISGGKLIAATGVPCGFDVRRDLSKEQFVERYSFQRPFIEVWDLPTRLSEPLTVILRQDKKLYPRTALYPMFNAAYPESLSCGRAFVADEPEEKIVYRFEKDEDPAFSFKTEEIPVLYREKINSLTTEEIAPCRENADRFSLSEREFRTVAFPYEDTGFISCTVTCDAPAEVWFLYDEILVGGDVLPFKHTQGIISILPLKLAPGTHRFFALEPRSMRYLKAYCASGRVTIENLRLIEYVNPGVRMKFESDDEALNRVFAAAKHTFEQNSVDVFMDCPSRERAGWLCDSFFTGRVERLLTGDNKVEKAFLENFFIASCFPQLPKGMFPMCYPSDEMDNFIPNWAMFLVVELEEYVARSGDAAMLPLAKERLYDLAAYFRGFENKDGLLEGLKAWVFVEWSQANKWVQNVNFPSNMMYYAMLKSMARLYDDKALDERAETLKQVIRAKSFNGTFYRDHQVYDEQGILTTPEDITEVCQYYAFFTGVADKEHDGALLNIIAHDFGAGGKAQKTHPEVYPANAFIGNYLRMEVLSKNGCRAQIKDEIIDYFDYMAKETGTLWENDNPHASCNHGFASHAALLILRDCLGLERVDYLNRVIYLNDDFTPPLNAEAKIPGKTGTAAILTIENGVRTVEAEGQFTIG